MSLSRFTIRLLVAVALFSRPTYADFFGGDLALLAQILANTVQQLSRLQSIVGNGSESLALMKQINKGVNDAMNIIRTQNTTLAPGILSELTSVSQVLDAVEGLYGKIPNTSAAQLQSKTDISISESIHLNNEAFRYADRVDPEVERLKVHAQNASPSGAQKLTVQAVAVLTHVANQLLRTNAAMLKLQSEQLALQNRRDKLTSQQFKAKYEALSKSFRNLGADYSLAPMK